MPPGMKQLTRRAKMPGAKSNTHPGISAKRRDDTRRYRQKDCSALCFSFMRKRGLISGQGWGFMIFNAKNRQAVIDNDTMNYIEFGKGSRPLVMIPGLGDGLSPVRGRIQAAAFAWNYRKLARHFKVYVFSRKNHLREGCSTRDMARDQAQVMKALGICDAMVLGVSQGGMIAQYLAIDYPGLVNKLVLAVTLSKQNGTLRETVGGWIEMAEKKDYKGLLIDTAEKSYSGNYLKKYRRLYPILGRIGRPKSFRRFFIQAASCLGHDAYAELNKITCPVLIIGGGQDQVAGRDASMELAEKIKDSRLMIYKDLGHGVYEEAPDFEQRVLDFLKV